MSRTSKQPGIYRISCKKARGIYIGRSVNINQRWRTHRHELDEGTHHNDQLQAAYTLYGPEALTWTIVKKTRWFLPAWEKFYWRKAKMNPLNTCYNQIKPSRAQRRWWMLWRE